MLVNRKPMSNLRSYRWIFNDIFAFNNINHMCLRHICTLQDVNRRCNFYTQCILRNIIAILRIASILRFFDIRKTIIIIIGI